MRLLPALAVLSLLLSGCARAPDPTATAPTPAQGSVPAAMDPVQAVLGASQRFGQLRSFHASLRMQGPRTVEATMDFVAPDRYRLVTDDGPQLIIGDTFFLQRAGEVRQVPVPPGLLAQWRNPLPPDLAPAQLQVEDLGSDAIGGQPAHKYRVRHASAAPDGMLYWINAQGLPVQIERQGQTKGETFRITLRFSRFDDPALRIDLP
ncbi:hypothetical protein [Stenotrophomonas rhizophila]|uniref:hypothetical protein n=1 Tax=Stenotrophomonas rhizophila TaxID=216778 RepID=UPI0010C09404|nr:hypothetical protein [Stenotrophomonas rhizophila]TKK07302.1 hypothetical protein SrhCFBP13529_10930 [Stenotrophomonas rhizophila]